jgi:membrane protein DedA with SNARE-associated domain
VEQWLTEFFSSHGPLILYCLTFLVLILCGLGLPVPEEATFLAAGFACGKIAGANVWILCVIGVLGILAGDTIPFYAGYRYGNDFLNHRLFRRFLTPANLERTRQFFRKRGARAVFIARFLAGLRMPTFFMSGTMGVTYGTFLFWDGLGALISCPTSIWLAHTFGEDVRQLIKESNLFITVFLGLLIAYALYRHWRAGKNAASNPEKPAESAAGDGKPATNAQELRH